MHYYLRKVIAYILYGVGHVLWFVAAMCILVWVSQVFKWFKTGEWEVISIASLFYKDVAYPVLEWKGVERIVHWIIEYQISGGLAFWMAGASLIVLIAAFFLDDSFDEQ